MLQVVRELILELVTPDGLSTSTISQRVARLDHKLGNDPVENDAFIVPAAGMADKVLYCFRCLLREQSEMDIANGCVDSGRISKR
jgi:hypothetical protein